MDSSADSTSRQAARSHSLVLPLLAAPLLAAALAVVLATAGTAQAQEEQAAVHDIYDAAGLMAMADDPQGSYRLMTDIDLEGVAWQPFSFGGTLEGNGHAILNAHVSATADERHTTYDGNMKSYNTLFSGFFGSLEGAVVHDVQFLGLDIDVESAEPTFVGGVCGYMADGTVIEGCVVSGEASLATTGASFGVGGIAGFGSGKIEGCTADVTLVCRDLDVEYKDEQFLGGAFANGYIDLMDTDVTIRGFDSDHGYVHDGGLIGMYIDYVGEEGHTCYVTGNHVSGFITFFEDNLDRRAYCDPVIGECMSYNVVREGNTDEFVRDERFEYGTDLLPHTCENPVWDERVVEGDCDTHGYTLHTCEVCGYEYASDWTGTVHSVDEWVATGDTTQDGLAVYEGTCTRCDASVYQLGSAPAGQDGNEASEDVDAGATVTEADRQHDRATAFDVADLMARVVIAALVALVAVIGILIWLRTHR